MSHVFFQVIIDAPKGEQNIINIANVLTDIVSYNICKTVGPEQFFVDRGLIVRGW